MKPYHLQKASATDLPFPDNFFDLVVGSPPYQEARKLGAKPLGAWVQWMIDNTQEALRVSKGLVLWVCAGTGNYNAGPEGLIWRLQERGVRVLRPLIWTANKPPTNAGRWFSNQWEYIIPITKTWPLPYFDASSIATPLKYSSGGAFRQYGKDGKRKPGSSYPTHKIRKTIPNLIHTVIGGGHMGHPLATENEACYPESLVTPLIQVLCPPGGKVLDPFCGSGTTVAAAVKLGRIGYGTDIRQSQIALSERRLKDVMKSLKKGNKT